MGLLVLSTKRTKVGPRKRYIKERRIYQQYMDDRDKQAQQEQKNFRNRLHEAASTSNVRERLRRRQDRVKQGSPPPQPPLYCPHWHKARPEPQKAWTKIGTERLGAYEDGHVSRLERYEGRLRDPTSKEARQKAARETRYSSRATTLCGAPVSPEAELVDMFDRLWELKRLYEQQDELSEEGAGARQEQLEENRAEMHQDEDSSTEGSMSWPRSIGTGAPKGKNLVRSSCSADSMARRNQLPGWA
ncbi:hypothetical protein SLS63_001028 [Diaporthe eres]|uniref:Uncharacterized protein n=1 Tax=Diaporthe eres TaxID=83184 RepID=A0ABR1PPJ3_DIAER